METVATRRARMGRALGNLYRFLNLVSFVALVLGGIGVGSSVHAYVKQKFSTIAILRCVGAEARQATHGLGYQKYPVDLKVVQQALDVVDERLPAKGATRFQRLSPAAVVKGDAAKFSEECSHLLPPAHMVAATSVGEDYRRGRIVAMGLVIKFYSVDRRFGHSRPPFDLFLLDLTPSIAKSR